MKRFNSLEAFAGSFGMAPGAFDAAAMPTRRESVEGSSRADSRWWHVRFLGDSLHLETHEVVGERDGPELLPSRL